MPLKARSLLKNAVLFLSGLVGWGILAFSARAAFTFVCNHLFGPYASGFLPGVCTVAFILLSAAATGIACGFSFTRRVPAIGIGILTLAVPVILHRIIVLFFSV